MNVALITCWFATSYGAYSDSLRKAMAQRLGTDVKIIASNCGCGDPVEVGRKFQNHDCNYYEFPHIHYFKSKNPIKYKIRNSMRGILYGMRAKKYIDLAKPANVMHFQQTLNAFGSVAVFKWLGMPSNAARVITVHELDPYQLDCPESNLAYNLAERIIVHDAEIKEKLIRFGVAESKIVYVHYGVELRPIEQAERDGIIFYGGHHFNASKGLDTLIQAMALIREKAKIDIPKIKIHGHYGDTIPESILKIIKDYNFENEVIWLNQIDMEQIVRLYQRSLICVLPYRGSLAALPAVNALANGVPVIGTRRAGLPEHLDELGNWIEESDAQGLAESIVQLITDEDRRSALGLKGRSRAESSFSWDTIATKTIEIYNDALLEKEKRKPN